MIMNNKYYVIILIFLVFILFPIIFNIVELSNEQFDNSVTSIPQINNKNANKENIPYGIQSIQFLNNGMQPNQFAHSDQK